ncbi:MAG: hypothetical protein ABR958_07085 [Dehalococcoidales bacterium]|jgi:hypothetical protein
MDYVYIVLFLIVLVLALVGISRIDAKTKKKYKQDAYRLLEASDAGKKKVRDTIKGLRLYGGRWRKDKECTQLIERLQTKLGADS